MTGPAIAGLGFVVGDLEPAVAAMALMGASGVERSGDSVRGRLGRLWFEIAVPAPGTPDEAWMARHGPGVRRLMVTPGAGWPDPAAAEAVLGYLVEPSPPDWDSDIEVSGPMLPARIHQVGTVAAELGPPVELLRGFGAGEFESRVLDSEMFYRGRPVIPTRLVGIAPFGRLTIEVVVPVKGEGLPAADLAERGPGINHIAFATPSDREYAAAYEVLRGSGLESTYGCRMPIRDVDYMDTRGALGIWIELVGRHAGL